MKGELKAANRIHYICWKDMAATMLLSTLNIWCPRTNRAWCRQIPNK